MKTNLSREEMIDLVTRIVGGQGTEEEIIERVLLFTANCKHPDKSNLIFWPHGIPHDPSKPEPTVEQIVDKAMQGNGVIYL